MSRQPERPAEPLRLLAEVGARDTTDGHAGQFFADLPESFGLTLVMAELPRGAPDCRPAATAEAVPQLALPGVCPIRGSIIESGRAPSVGRPVKNGAWFWLVRRCPKT